MDIEKAINEALHRSPEGLILQRRLTEQVVKELNFRSPKTPIIFGRMKFLEDADHLKVVALTSTENGEVKKHDLTLKTRDVLVALHLASYDIL